LLLSAAALVESLMHDVPAKRKSKTGMDGEGVGALLKVFSDRDSFSSCVG